MLDDVTRPSKVGSTTVTRPALTVPVPGWAGVEELDELDDAGAALTWTISPTLRSEKLIVWCSLV